MKDDLEKFFDTPGEKSEPKPKGKSLGSLEEMLRLSNSNTEQEMEAWKDMPFGIRPSNVSSIDTEMHWLVDGLVPLEGIGILYGSTRSFKTFIAIHLCFCIGLGADFLGINLVQGLSLYWTGEGKRGFGKRKDAWAKRNGAFQGMFEFKSPLQFGDLTALAELEMEVRILFGPDLRLVVIDTMSKAKVMDGKSTVNPDDMAIFLRGLEDLAERCGLFVLLIDHENAAGSLMGTKQKSANVDLLLHAARLKGNKDIYQTVIDVEKNKEGEENSYTINLEQIDLGDGVSSLAVIPESTSTHHEGERSARNAALYLLKEGSGYNEKPVINSIVDMAGVKLESARRELGRMVAEKLVRKTKSSRLSLTDLGRALEERINTEAIFPTENEGE